MIRNANNKDITYIESLLSELGYPPYSKNDLLESITKYSTPPHTIIVYELDKKIVAFISIAIIPMFHVNSNFGRITALCVNENYRGQGIGTKLLKYAKQYCIENNCQKIEVTSGNRREREKTHNFYLKNGMIIDSKRFSEIIGK